MRSKSLLIAAIVAAQAASAQDAPMSAIDWLNGQGGGNAPLTSR